MADTKYISRGLIGSERWTRLQQRLIHIPEDPVDPPVNIFYGFWFQTVPPSGCGDFKTTILSNSETPEPDRICQQEYEQGIAGIVKIEPSKSPRYGKAKNPLDIVQFRR